MQSTSTAHSAIADYRTKIESALAADQRFGPAWRDDRPDGAALATRFPVGSKLWIELVIRPDVPQIRAGIMTDDRWLNEELEEAIEESGDTMPEFVEYGFDEAGLEWPAPIVEHFRDQGKYFCFLTSFEPESLAELTQPATVDKSHRMLLGYYEAFKKVIARHLV